MTDKSVSWGGLASRLSDAVLDQVACRFRTLVASLHTSHAEPHPISNDMQKDTESQSQQKLVPQIQNHVPIRDDIRKWEEGREVVDARQNQRQRTVWSVSEVPLWLICKKSDRSEKDPLLARIRYQTAAKTLFRHRSVGGGTSC